MDTAAPITHLVRRLEQADTARLDEAAARAALADVARVRNWAVAVRASLVQRLDALGEAAASPPAGGGPPASGDACGGDAAPAGSHAPGGGAVPAGSAGPVPCPKPAELELADTGRVSEREAAREAALARLLGRFPDFAAALRRSTVAESHLRVLGRLWQQLELQDRHRLMELDAHLVVLAAGSDPERFRRVVSAELNRRRERDGVDRLMKQRRASGLTHWVDDSGMVNVRARFDPERGQHLLNRIRQRRQEIIDAHAEPPECPDGDLRWEHLNAIALYDLTDGGSGVSGGSGASGASGAGGAGQGGAAVGRRSMFSRPDAEMVVVIDEATLRTGYHEHSHVDTGPVDLPLSTLRRLACDAGIVPVVLGGDGVVLDVGRTRRLATHAQRVALRVMHPTCAVPGCDVGFDYCQPHHLEPWVPSASAGRAGAAPSSGGGGPDADEGRAGTDLSNLLPL